MVKGDKAEGQKPTRIVAPDPFPNSGRMICADCKVPLKPAGALLTLIIKPEPNVMSIGGPSLDCVVRYCPMCGRLHPFGFKERKE